MESGNCSGIANTETLVIMASARLARLTKATSRQCNLIVYLVDGVAPINVCRENLGYFVTNCN